jgi:hypothetical protein
MPATVVALLRRRGTENTALGELEEKIVAKTNRLGALAVVAGAALVAVGLLVLMMLVVDVQPAGRPFPAITAR